MCFSLSGLLHTVAYKPRNYHVHRLEGAKAISRSLIRALIPFTKAGYPPKVPLPGAIAQRLGLNTCIWGDTNMQSVVWCSLYWISKWKKKKVSLFSLNIFYENFPASRKVERFIFLEVSFSAELNSVFIHSRCKQKSDTDASLCFWGLFLCKNIQNKWSMALT